MKSSGYYSLPLFCILTKHKNTYASINPFQLLKNHIHQTENTSMCFPNFFSADIKKIPSMHNSLLYKIFMLISLIQNKLDFLSTKDFLLRLEKFVGSVNGYVSLSALQFRPEKYKCYVELSMQFFGNILLPVDLRSFKCNLRGLSALNKLKLIYII